MQEAVDRGSLGQTVTGAIGEKLGAAVDRRQVRGEKGEKILAGGLGIEPR